MKVTVALLLSLFVSFNIFPEEHLTGKMLIMGWEFVERDTPLQTNNAIDAIIKYAEASKFQMISEERYNPSCRIELYENFREFYEDEGYSNEVYIYINCKDPDNFFDRHIEIDFYIIKNRKVLKYKLVFSFNDYGWTEDSDEKGMWGLVMRDEGAYDFFVSWIKGLRQ